MNVSRTWSCLLLSGAMLNLSGCDQIRKIFGNDGGGGGVHGLTTATLSINGCSVVDPSTGRVVDPIVQKPGTPVTWNFSDQKVYVITFNPKYDKTSQSNITPPANSITHTSSGVTWNNANTPKDCGDNGGGCYFKYNIWLGGTPAAPGPLCSDPGIQIIP
jgi:hypothetical protein